MHRTRVAQLDPLNLLWSRLLGWFWGDSARVRRAEQAAASERRALEQIFALTPAAMALWRGEDLVFEMVNPRFMALFGHRPLLGKPFLEALPEFKGQTFSDLILNVLRTGEPYVGHEVLARHRRTADGPVEDRYYDFTYVRINDAEGNPVGVYDHAIDVTDRVLARRRVEESEGRLKLALTGAKMGTWRVNLKEGGVNLSSEAQRIFGFAKTYDSVHHAIREFIHPDDQAHAAEVLARALEKREPYSDQYRILWPNGEERWVNLRGQATYDTDGNPLVLTGVVLDITEMKQVERELAEAVRARDEFLSIASHELKTPLTSLTLQSQTFKRRINIGDPTAYSPERVSLFVQQTERQILRLNRLVDDMLDISRIRAGTLGVQPVPGRLRDVVEETLERMGPQFAAAGTEFPETDFRDDGQGNWDHVRLEQVVANLLTNAIRYGQGKPICVRLTGSEEWICLQVKDQGMGITPEAQARIFKRFERGISADEVSGLGLGLFISKQIVEAHGGSIRVDSKPGEGAEFTVQLPRYSPSIAPSGAR